MIKNERKVTPTAGQDSPVGIAEGASRAKSGGAGKKWGGGAMSALGTAMKLAPLSRGSKNIPSQPQDISAARVVAPSGASNNANGLAQSSVRERMASVAAQMGSSYMKAPRIIYRGHKNSIMSLSIITANSSPACTDTLILSGSEDKTLNVWSLTTAELVVSLQGHRHRVSGVVGICNDQCPPVAVTCSWDETLRIWPLQSCFPALSSTADSGDAKSEQQKVSVSADAILKQSIQLTGFKNRVLCITSLLLEDNKPAVAAGSSDSTIQIFSVPNGETLFVLCNKEEATWNLCVTSWTIDASSDDPTQLSGPVIISGCKNSTVRIWKASRGSRSKVASRKPFRVIKNAHDSAVHAVAAFDYKGPLVVTACKELDIKIFSVLSGELMKVLRGHTFTIKSIAAHDISVRRGGAIITSASANGNVRVWKYSTGEVLRTFNGHTEEIGVVTAFRTPEPEKDDLIIVSGSKDQTVRTWLFAEEKSLKVLQHVKETAASAAGVVTPKASSASKNKVTVRVSAICVYSSSRPSSVPLIVTGADDGYLRAWTATQSEEDEASAAAVTGEGKDEGEDAILDDLVWSKAAHRSQILAVAIYVPPQQQMALDTLLEVDEDDEDIELDQNEAGAADNQRRRPSQNSIPRARDVAATGGAAATDDASLDLATPRSMPSNFELPPVITTRPSTGLSSGGGSKDPLLNREKVKKFLRRAFVVSCCRDGIIRVGALNNATTICRFFAHSSVVTSLSIFNGATASMDAMNDAAEAGNGELLDAFLVSGSEDNTAKVWLLDDVFTAVVENRIDADTRMIKLQPHQTLSGHEFDVTAVAVYLPTVKQKKTTKKDRIKERSVLSSGANSLSTPVKITQEPLTALGRQESFIGGASVTDSSSVLGSGSAPRDPIIITASVDSTIFLWSYSSGECLEVLTDAKDYLTSLCVIERTAQTEPMLAAGDGSGKILVWSLEAPFSLKQTLGGHTDEISSLSMLDVEGKYPVMISGSLDNTIRIWDMKRMKFKRVIEGHTDDILAVSVFNDSKQEPAIASGAADSTVRILFDFMGNVNSADVVRQQFEFDLLRNNVHVLNGKSGKGIGSTGSDGNSTQWPRVSMLVQKDGADTFFGSYYELFGEALRAGRSDFLVEFLPLTKLGLIKSNGELEDNCADDGRGGLLRQAIESKDIVAVRVIISCWCTFLAADPESDTDAIHDPLLSRISLADMLLLAENYPKEFEKLICSIKLLPVQFNKIPKGSRYLRKDKNGGLQIVHYHEGDLFDSAASALDKVADNALDALADAANSTAQEFHAIAGQSVSASTASTGGGTGAAVAAAATAVKGSSSPVQNRSKGRTIGNSSFVAMDSMDAAANAAAGNHDDEDEEEVDAELELRDDFDEAHREQTFLFLPVDGLVHMEMLRAFTEVSAKLDSVEIFNSECGQLALSYAWNTFGIRAHSYRMLIYLFYVGVTTASLISFEAVRNSLPLLSIILFAVQLLVDAYFIYEEHNQYLAGIIEYCSDIWNLIDLCVILSNLSSNVLRLIYWRDTTASLVLLCINSVLMWFNILYFLRAVEATGPLVSMILKISSDMKYLIFVVLLVLLGFSQAFWLLSRDDSDLAFSTIDASLLNSFSFMLGGYDPEGFNGARLEQFAVFLSAVYMLIVSILLLNLLIALMGDSYGAVKEKGLAQWKLEQCEMITEMRGSMKNTDVTCMAVVYFRKATEELLHAEGSEEEAGKELSAAAEERFHRIEDTLVELKSNMKDFKKGQEEILKMQRTLGDVLSRLSND